MCDPVTATALALSAGGTYLETREANKNAKRVQQAKNATFERNMIEQQKFADEAGAAFNHNIDKQGRDQFDEQQQQSQDQFKKAFADVRTQPDYNTALPPSAAKNVVIARKQAKSKADETTNRDLEGLSGLQGYGGALFNQGLDRNEFGRLFGNINDEALAKNRLLPIELQAAANNAQKGPSLFPTLLKAGGMALGMYGAANGITSFGDKIVEGPVAAGTFGPGAPVTQPGLFSSMKTSFGGLY